ncbi:MAG: acetoacetate--CoA ligase [Lautropia sp.]
MTDDAAILWQPSAGQIEQARLSAFIDLVRTKHPNIASFDDLYRFSIDEMGAFWSAVWDFAGLVGDKGAGPFLVESARMQDAQWFPGASLNIAENLLGRDSDELAIIAHVESGARRTLTRTEYRAETFRCIAALRSVGVQPGDRVAGWLPHVPETVIAATAALGIGAAWSTCSTDLATPAVVDRLSRIQPSVLFVADAVTYRGQSRSLVGPAIEIARQVPSIRAIVVVTAGGEAALPDTDSRLRSWQDFVGGHAPTPTPLPRFPFDHPSYVLFTSGTSGPPKCIVHRTGGVLLKHAVDHLLHSDLRPGDRFLRATSTGWVTWNYQVSVLAFGGTIVLYDGHPFSPKSSRLLDILAEDRVTHWGTSPDVLVRWARDSLHPKSSHDLSALRYISAGGSLLSRSSYRYVYDAIKDDVHLSSPSGGTELLSVFSGGNPTGPCVEGEIQTRGLGMKVEIFDGDGNSIVGAPGELVCTGPFPTMPLGFWGEDKTRYEEQYFSRYANVWRHGDRAEITPRGGVKMLGRSDATLNIHGVRIGIAEIYTQLGSFAEISAAAVIEHPMPAGGSTMVLFVCLRPGTALGAELVETIRHRLRTNCSPRHVPEFIIEAPDLPRTVVGKVSELAIKAALAGREPEMAGSLANPKSLEFFRVLTITPGRETVTR